MKIKTSLFAIATVGCLLLAGTLVWANAETEATTSGASSETTSEAGTTVSTAETIDQAAIVPKNEDDKTKGVEVWGDIYKVLSHPRCVNCHVPDDRPRWSGKHYGKTQVHGMNIQATATRMGKPGEQMCTTCHAKTNSDVRHGPPGAEVWALAPVEMIWWDKSSKELCAIVKDPSKTGGRDITTFAEHISHDALVAWGWNPGLGREPAPFSAEKTVAMLEQWLALGLPCPE